MRIKTEKSSIVKLLPDSFPQEKESVLFFSKVLDSEEYSGNPNGSWNLKSGHEG